MAETGELFLPAMSRSCELVLLPIFFFACNLLLSSGQSNQVCISPGGRFPPFSSDGKPPKRVAKGPRDLVLCSVFRKFTCCDVAQTYPALVSIRKLASAGHASQDCLDLWELLECSICDPRVGTQPGPPVVCDSFCDNIWKACSGAYFSFDSKTQVLSPCGPEDILCGAASEWVSNGTELCHSAGFSVQPLDSQVARKQYCYGGKVSLDSIADSWKSSKSDLSQNGETPWMLLNFQKWFMKMPITHRISWAVGGLVLTAGLFFHSQRKSYRHCQKQAAITRTAKKLDTKVSRSPVAEGGRKVARR